VALLILTVRMRGVCLCLIADNLHILVSEAILGVYEHISGMYVLKLYDVSLTKFCEAECILQNIYLYLVIVGVC
jgi:hypothetical protein